MFVRVYVTNKKTKKTEVGYCDVSNLGEAAKRVLNRVEDHTPNKDLPEYWDVRVLPLGNKKPMGEVIYE